MISIFISHKKEDGETAALIAKELNRINVHCYLDLLDTQMTQNGKALTDHIKNNLNKCTDIIVVMSEITKLSQWVPFEVGMSAQKDMPTATFLQANVSLPEYLEYWPRLKKPEDILEYVKTRNEVYLRYDNRGLYESVQFNTSQTERFYAKLKERLN